jgi:hypothetical protein
MRHQEQIFQTPSPCSSQSTETGGTAANLPMTLSLNALSINNIWEKNYKGEQLIILNMLSTARVPLKDCLKTKISTMLLPR